MRDQPELHPHPAYTVQMPETPRPIYLIGAGGIVRDAHLPAYRKAGFTVAGIYNRTRSRAEALATEFDIPAVYDDLAAMIAGAPGHAVFDLALMPEQYEQVLEALPDGAAVLIQKPLGHELATGQRLLEICRRKRLVASVNTQLRFAPYVEEARKLIAAGEIGELYDLEIRVQVHTPWEMFPHVLTLDRLEINMHSVHYIDLVRSFLGNPTGISAVTERHPEKNHSTSRTVILFRYAGRDIRVVIATNHDHEFGPEREESFIKWEGTRGAIFAQMGLLLDYPRGREDLLRINRRDAAGWQDVDFSGSWFPDAFIGSMAAIQRYLEGSVDSLATSVEDVIDTMAVVEAAYTSAEGPGIRPEYNREA